ncbi:unnamed protein product [Urochloa humidicola]
MVLPSATRCVLHVKQAMVTKPQPLGIDRFSVLGDWAGRFGWMAWKSHSSHVFSRKEMSAYYLEHADDGHIQKNFDDFEEEALSLYYHWAANSSAAKKARIRQLTSLGLSKAQRKLLKSFRSVSSSSRHTALLFQIIDNRYSTYITVISCFSQTIATLQASAAVAGLKN